MSDQSPDRLDEVLGQRLRTELPRYTAPPALRAAIMEGAAPRSKPAAWVAPGMAALATAAVLLLFFLPLLPRGAPPDPTQRLVRAVVSEHSRVLMWGARRPEIVSAASTWLTQESGISLARTFPGDDVLTLLGAEPVYLERQRGVALHYRDGDGHVLTYIALPAPWLRMVDRDRVQIDRYRPMLTHDSGFATWVWKQRDIACFLVSDMVSKTDTERFKDYFVRVRVATEPQPAD